MGVLPLLVDAHRSEAARDAARARVRPQGPAAGGCDDCRGPRRARHHRRMRSSRHTRSPTRTGGSMAQTEIAFKFEQRPLDASLIVLLLALSGAVLCVACANVAGTAREPRAGARPRDVAAPRDRRRPRPARPAAADRDPGHRDCGRRSGARRGAARHHGAARHPVSFRHDRAADVRAGSARARGEPRRRDGERDPGRARPGGSDHPRRPCRSAEVVRPDRARAGAGCARARRWSRSRWRSRSCC